MNIHQLLQRHLKNMKDMRIIDNINLMINMNSENSDVEKLLERLTPEQGHQSPSKHLEDKKRTYNRLKYSKSVK